MEKLKVSKLKKGDTIGFIIPSSYNSADRFERLENIMKDLGFNVKYGKTITAKWRYLAGTDQERIDDIHNMFLDKEVKAIICLKGGFGASRIIDKIDYEIIKKDLLTQIKFIKTPIGYNDYIYMNDFEISGSIYNEIYMKNELDDEDIYLEHPRGHTYWFSYNDDKKEISFSCIFHFEPITRKNKEDFSKWLSYQFDA